MKATLIAMVFIVGLSPCANGQGTISGYAFSMDTADPAPGAIIYLKNEFGIATMDRPPVESDADGYYEFTDVEPGRYVMTATGKFEDLEGAEFKFTLVTEVFEVGSDGEEVHFGFSIAELKVRYLTSEPIARYSPPDERGGRQVTLPAWLSPRVHLIRSRIRIGRENKAPASSYADGNPVL